MVEVEVVEIRCISGGVVSRGNDNKHDDRGWDGKRDETGEVY